MKKFLSIITSVFMTLALFVGTGGGTSLVVNADSGSITITPPNNATKSQNYTIYKVFDAVGNGTNISYKLLSGKTTTDTAWTSSNMSTYFAVDSAGNVEARNNAYTSGAEGGNNTLTSEAVQAIAAYVTAASINATTTVQTTDAAPTTAVKANNLSDGYYYITTSTGSVVTVDSVNGQSNVNVNDKNTLPTVDKKQSTDTGESKTYNSTDVNVAIGDTIYYQAEVVVPNSVDGDITLTDTMSSGLTPGAEPTVKYQNTTSNSYETLEKGTDPNVNYTYETTSGTDSSTVNGFKIVIKNNSTTRGKNIHIEYSATVNASAISSDTVKQNEIKLEYKNESQAKTTKYKTYATGAIKFDGGTAEEDGNSASTGLKVKDGQTSIKYLQAQFQLEESAGSGSTWNKVNVSKNTAGGYYYPNSNDTSTVIDSNTTNGQIIIRGLDSDKQYRLKETKAPDGYNTLTSEVSLTVAEDSKASVAVGTGNDGNTTYLAANTENVKKIANNQGTVLPSTGGIGTTIFYVAGIVLVIGAAALLITKKKKNA